MTTAETPQPQAPRQSMLAKMAGPPRQSSPESLRRSFMLLITMAAIGLSGYFTVTLSGTTAPRLIMAFLCAGWFSLFLHTARDLPVTPKSPRG